MTKFICLAGKMQTGKTASANIIEKHLASLGYTSRITSFAEPLKEMCISILNLPRKLVFGTKADKETLTHICWDTLNLDIRRKYGQGNLRSGPMTIREVLQIVGTEIFREQLYHNVWAEAPFIKSYDDDFVILDDVRFVNEKIFAEGSGALVIRLKRDTGIINEHISETELDNVKFEHEYKNNGTLLELERYLIGVIDAIL